MVSRRIFLFLSVGDYFPKMPRMLVIAVAA